MKNNEVYIVFYDKVLLREEEHSYEVYSTMSKAKSAFDKIVKQIKKDIEEDNINVISEGEYGFTAYERAMYDDHRYECTIEKANKWKAESVKWKFAFSKVINRVMDLLNKNC